MDWFLLAVVTVAAIIGGYLGGKIMHYRLKSTQIKKLIAALLLLLAVKMTYSLVI